MPRAKVDPNQTAYVYALDDPITRETRYIGRTLQLPPIRLAQHVADAGHNQSWMQRAKTEWILDLARQNMMPKIRVFWQGRAADAPDVEWNAILLALSQGFKLLNRDKRTTALMVRAMKKGGREFPDNIPEEAAHELAARTV